MRRPATIVFVVVTALACLALVYFQRMGWLPLAAGAKFVASSGFLATALSVGALQHRFGQLIFIGLAFSFFGDLSLIGQSQSYFLLGLGSFLLAHVVYITAFVSRGQNRRWVFGAAIPVLVAAVFVLVWLMPHVPAELAIPVRVYIAVISLMVITAFGARGAGAPGLVVAGALMFFASDLSVAMQRIMNTEFPTIIWGLPLYFAGQTCIALSAASSAHRPD